MDQRYGERVLMGIECLRQLSCASPHSVYWGYIAGCGRQLGLPADDAEDFAIVRLACLVRAQRKDRVNIYEVWKGLSRADRQALTQHFLTDGINQSGFLFTF